MKIKAGKQTDIDTILFDFFLSRKIVYFLKAEKRVRVNGAVVTKNTSIETNDQIEIDILKPETNDIPVYDRKIEVLYEDAYLLIINKPIDILIYDSNNQNCLDNCVANYYQKNQQTHKVYHLHRLDRDTSGCIIYCKEPYLLAKLDYMIANKQIQRDYLALIEGKLENKITINKPIGRDRHINNKFRISSSGKQAITSIEPIKYENGNTLVKCRLKTGRTHQIRVHLSSINHPIVGDKIYGGKQANRLMLHSYSVSLIHPITNKKITIRCKCPF